MIAITSGDLLVSYWQEILKDIFILWLLLIFFLCFQHVAHPNSPAAQQNPDATSQTAGGASQRPAKDHSARRKDEAKQAAKKPKENALSQFDLNNYASE